MKDLAMAAFSVFFIQCPSFLAHQTAMLEARGKSNVQTLFGLRDIPSDNHIRTPLDPVPPQQLFPMFESIFTSLSEGGYLEAFRTTDQQLLIALDGTRYHASNTIHCKQCMVPTHCQGHPLPTSIDLTTH